MCMAFLSVFQITENYLQWSVGCCKESNCLILFEECLQEICITYSNISMIQLLLLLLYIYQRSIQYFLQ